MMPKSAAPRPANSAFPKPLTLSPELATLVGASWPCTEVVKKAQGHIKQHGLQDAVNKRMINVDAKLKPTFGKAQGSMFGMTKLPHAYLK
ncbi:MAG: SWIB/MDM2 domain-containing protein [Acidiferrobacteraceae bacterium]